MIKNILGRLWAVWGAIWFLITLLIFVWPIVISYKVAEPYGMRLFKNTSAVWMRVFLFIIGCPMRVKGKENYIPTENYVVVSNHQSFLDVPLMTPFFPGVNRTIAKKSMSKIPIFGWVYVRGSVLVDRASDGSRRKSFEDMRKVLLKENLNMAIYAEGTRNRTGLPLKEFYDGAFRLANDTKKDIIPVAIFNTAYALPPSKTFYLWPKRLEMHLLPVIKVEGKTVKEIKEETYNAIWNYLAAKNYAPPKG